MDFLKDLNDAQKKAVVHPDGPVLVIAGAGSGKTRVLTYRIAYMMSQGADPFNILALTFTNKAAREMKERIYNMAGPEARNLWMGTFHSVFARILRREHEKLAYPANFTIYDQDDAKNLVKSIIKSMNLDDKIYKPNVVLNRISRAKNSLISPKQYASDPELQQMDEYNRQPLIGTIYKRYNTRCYKAAAMDFDDLLFNTYKLLKSNEKVLYRYQNQFRHILVDEFQDTNHSQYAIIKMLADRFQNITVVGDDAQSIYAFRGANMENMRKFQQNYPDVSVYKLEQNYRSTGHIVEAANSLIKNNRQLPKKVWTGNPPGEKVWVLRALTDNEEGKLIAAKVFEIKAQQNRHNREFAVLYRTHAQSRSLEEAFRRLNIPYRVYGGISFYQRKEVKDLLAYCRLAVNQHDEESLKRVINYPSRKIGKTTVDKIVVAATDHGISMWEVITNIKAFNLNINTGTINRLDEFATLINRFANELPKMDAFEAGSNIAKGSRILSALYEDRSPEGVSRYENLQEVLNAMKAFAERKPANKDGETHETGLASFLQEVSLLTDADNEDPENMDRVSLMTVHQAKGLEFPCVFIAGMEENLFPSQMALSSREDIEEERRLFYVALTRAGQSAWLSYCESRYRWGSMTFNEPSRFIEEIEDQHLNFVTAPQNRQQTNTLPWKNRQPGRWKAKAKKESTVVQRAVPKHLKKVTAPQASQDFTGDVLTDLKAGTTVRHQRFGLGKVISVEGNVPNQKATVAFEQAGTKQLLLRFAKLQIIR